MKSLCLLSILVLSLISQAADIEVVALASIAQDRVATTGLKVERKTNMPDFTVTYLHGPKPNDVIGIYEGSFPTMFVSSGKLLGRVKDTIAEKHVEWVCWSEEQEGKKRYGAETRLPSRRIIVREAKLEDSQEFHVWVIRSDLKALAEARKLAGSLFQNESRSKAAQALSGKQVQTEPRPRGVGGEEAEFGDYSAKEVETLRSSLGKLRFPVKEGTVSILLPRPLKPLPVRFSDWVPDSANKGRVGGNVVEYWLNLSCVLKVATAYYSQREDHFNMEEWAVILSAEERKAFERPIY